MVGSTGYGFSIFHSHHILFGGIGYVPYPSTNPSSTTLASTRSGACGLGAAGIDWFFCSLSMLQAHFSKVAAFSLVYHRNVDPTDHIGGIFDRLGGADCVLFICNFDDYLNNQAKREM